jgi:glycogen operon protein
MHQFVRKAVAMRRRHPGLRRVQFFHGDRGDGNPPDIRWFGPDGHEPDWARGDALGCLLSGAREHTGARHTDDHLALLFNAGANPVEFRIPASDGKAWRIVLSTEDKRPAWEISQETIPVDGRAVLVLASAREGGAA